MWTPTTAPTRNPVRSTDWSMSGIWRTCPITSARCWTTSGERGNTSLPLRCTDTARTRTPEDIWSSTRKRLPWWNECSRWPAAGSGRTRSRKYSTAKGSPVLLPTNSSTVFPTRPLCKGLNHPSGGRRRSTRCCATAPIRETWSRAVIKRSVTNPNGQSGCRHPSGS